MPFRVTSALCATCIFSDRSLLRPGRFDDLKKTWEKRHLVQECHHATPNDGQASCRGHFEAFRRGETKNHPLRDLATRMGLPPSLTDGELAAHFESLGYIVFVHLEE